MPDAKRAAYVGPAQVRRALRALRQIAADPNRTDAVGEFISSLTGPSAARLFQKVVSDPVGRRLLDEKRDLRATLENRDYLAALPPGSLGHLYHAWTADRQFSADGIAATIHQVSRELATPENVMAARVVDMHDLWHVVNGWGSDIHGEIHLLGYSYAQLGAYAWLILAMLSASVLATAGHFEAFGYLRNSIRRGRRAVLLAAVDWEALLPLPVDEVRRRLRVDEPEPYTKLDFAEIEELVRRSPVVRLLRSALPA